MFRSNRINSDSEEREYWYNKRRDYEEERGDYEDSDETPRETTKKAIYDPMPIFEASSNGYTETLSKLVKNGANINIVNDKGMTPLHMAIKNGHTKTVKVLIAAGANISTASAINGWTPLYIACAKGHTAIVNALIEAGADVNVPMATGVTPLSIAIMKSHIDIVVALMKAGAGKKCAIY